MSSFAFRTTFRNGTTRLAVLAAILIGIFVVGFIVAREPAAKAGEPVPLTSLGFELTQRQGWKRVDPASPGAFIAWESPDKSAGAELKPFSPSPRFEKPQGELTRRCRGVFFRQSAAE